MSIGLVETVPIARASARFIHWRVKPGATFKWLPGGIPDLSTVDVLSDEVSFNVLTTAGRDFLHLQGYQTTGLATNGLNYIGASDDPLIETSSSTTLSSEIVANGLTRAQGTVSHTSGTNLTTISKTFTCSTASQGVQKVALFSASSAGAMNHVIALPTRIALNVTDLFNVIYSVFVG